MNTSCQNVPFRDQKTTWDEQLSELMPYLGHRNWIVIADMAYPMQSGSGITTLYADEPYAQVASKIKKLIDNAPHVFAHVYNDRELSFISEEDAPGIGALRQTIRKTFGEESQSLPHMDLIARLDEAGKLYKVIIIKTPLTMAYTTTFFELDCDYWSAQKQARLDQAMAQAQDD